MPVRRHPIATSAVLATPVVIPIDVALIARLRTTYEQVRDRPLDFAERFYAKLFAEAPQLRALFRGDIADQARKLTASLDVVVQNLEDPAANAAMLAELGRRHVGHGARPEHYDVVVRLLVDAMAEVLGPGTDRRHLDEWRMALRLVSDRMIAAANHAAGAPGAPGTVGMR